MTEHQIKVMQKLQDVADAAKALRANARRLIAPLVKGDALTFSAGSDQFGACWERMAKALDELEKEPS